MSQNVENVSLVSLVSLKGTTSRGDADDVKAKNFSKKAIKNGGFDGFLQTFLGKDKKSVGSGGNKKGPGSGLGVDEKKAIKDSLGKTVPGSGDDLSPEAAAAAREAADILWNLLYGPQAGWGGAALSGVGGASGNSLQYISSLIKQSGVPVYGTGASGINLAAMQDAIDTSNASAEMNNDATLAALDGLLDGLPQGALEAALFQTAAAKGYAGGGGSFLSQIASALDAEIISVEHKPGGNLLSMLSGTASMTVAADSAGENGEFDGLTNLLNAFLKENGKDAAGESPIKMLQFLTPEMKDEMLDNFAKFLSKPENSSMLKKIESAIGDMSNFLARAAKTANVPLDDELSSLFSEMATRLESALHSSSTITAAGNPDQRVAGKNATADSNDTDSGGDNPSGGETAASQAGPTGGTGETAAADTGEAPTSLSTMLDQIDNIERLSEAMKMSRRNGGVTNLTMQLSPAELGRVMLRVESRNGVVSAHLRVEKKEALKELTVTLSRLKENLEKQGIDVGELTIVQPGEGESLGDFSSGNGSAFRDKSGFGSDSFGSGGERGGFDDSVRTGLAPGGGGEPGSGTTGDDGGGLNVFV